LTTATISSPFKASVMMRYVKVFSQLIFSYFFYFILYKVRENHSEMNEASNEVNNSKVYEGCAQPNDCCDYCNASQNVGDLCDEPTWLKSSQKNAKESTKDDSISEEFQPPNHHEDTSRKRNH
jgi:hypothetical protein